MRTSFSWDNGRWSRRAFRCRFFLSFREHFLSIFSPRVKTHIPSEHFRILFSLFLYFLPSSQGLGVACACVRRVRARCAFVVKKNRKQKATATATATATAEPKNQSNQKNQRKRPGYLSVNGPTNHHRSRASSRIVCVYIYMYRAAVASNRLFLYFFCSRLFFPLFEVIFLSSTYLFFVFRPCFPPAAHLSLRRHGRPVVRLGLRQKRS